MYKKFIHLLYKNFKYLTETFIISIIINFNLVQIKKYIKELF